MGVFTPRYTSPAGLYLPYYMKTGTYTGALNDAILGNGAVTGANVLNNCVGYSVGRCAEVYNILNDTTANPTNPFNIFATHNAEEWYAVAQANNIPTGMTPQIGAVGVYYAPNQNIGHVCNIEAYVNGVWEISESHYYHPNPPGNGSWDYSYLQINLIPAFIGADPDWQLLGFIYPYGTIPPAGGSIASIYSVLHRRKKTKVRIYL